MLGQVLYREYEPEFACDQDILIHAASFTESLEPGIFGRAKLRSSLLITYNQGHRGCDHHLIQDSQVSTTVVPIASGEIDGGGIAICKTVITIISRVDPLGLDTTEWYGHMRREWNLDYLWVEKRVCEPYLEHKPWQAAPGSIESLCM